MVWLNLDQKLLLGYEIFFWGELIFKERIIFEKLFWYLDILFFFIEEDIIELINSLGLRYNY